MFQPIFSCSYIPSPPISPPVLSPRGQQNQRKNLIAKWQNFLVATSAFLSASFKIKLYSSESVWGWKGEVNRSPKSQKICPQLKYKRDISSSSSVLLKCCRTSMSLEIVKKYFSVSSIAVPLSPPRTQACVNACMHASTPTYTHRVSWQVSVGKFEKRALLVMHTVSKHPRTSAEVS